MQHFKLNFSTDLPCLLVDQSARTILALIQIPTTKTKSHWGKFDPMLDPILDPRTPAWPYLRGVKAAAGAPPQCILHQLKFSPTFAPPSTKISAKLRHFTPIHRRQSLHQHHFCARLHELHDFSRLFTKFSFLTMYLSVF